MLDSIVKKHLVGSRTNSFDSTVFETVNATGTSEIADASITEQGYTFLLQIENGAGTINFDFTIEGSVDGNSWATIPGTTQNFTDTDGSVTWDIVDSNINYARIKWTVTSGTLDLFGIFSAKRRH